MTSVRDTYHQAALDAGLSALKESNDEFLAQKAAADAAVEAFARQAAERLRGHASDPGWHPQYRNAFHASAVMIERLAKGDSDE